MQTVNPISRNNTNPELSLPGFATYTLAIEHPEIFAAIAPDAAGADPSKVEALRGIPSSLKNIFFF